MLSLFFKGVKYLEPKTKLEGNYKSQYGQDWYLEKLGFLSKKNFFVEVGCNHPKINSNSYFLEHAYNYSGISIDAINYEKEFHALRPNTTFIQSLIDSKETTKIFNLVQLRVTATQRTHNPFMRGSIPAVAIKIDTSKII